MSLINEMLHDLDQRRGGLAPAEQQALLGLTAASGGRADGGRLVGVLMIVAAVCVTAAVAWNARGWFERGAVGYRLVSAGNAVAPAAVPAVPGPDGNPDVTVTRAAVAEPALAIAAPADVPAPAVAADMTMAEPAASSATVTVAAIDDEPFDIPLMFEPTQTAEATTPVERPGTFRRTPAAATGTEDPNALVRALRRIEAGDVATGMADLEAFIDARPDHAGARQQLAQAKLQTGDRAGAMATLRAGLARYPRDARMAEMLAHLLVGNDDVAGALAVLNAAAPPVAEAPAYHAFIAALVQRTGAHRQSAEAYRRVLAVRPDNGAWWIGLGISLTRLDDAGGAAAAFGRALQDPDLSANMQAYAGEQLQRLQPQG